jgi:hypothetical protein
MKHGVLMADNKSSVIQCRGQQTHLDKGLRRSDVAVRLQQDRH